MPEKTIAKIEQGDFFVIAGPCVIESEELCLQVAEKLAEIADKLEILLVFKSSYTKANRLSGKSYSGPGIDEGLKILSMIREEFHLPILTDVHETTDISAAAQVADILQIPAFLSRQTELVKQAAATGKWVNIKKGQFLAPEDMEHIAQKANSKKVMLTERGTTFGYHNLVVDFRSLLIMKETGLPVVFDATHSLQLPSGSGSSSTGQPKFTEALAKAAAAVGIDGLFVETHPNPEEALSDSGAMLSLDKIESLLQAVLKVRDSVSN